MSSPSLLVLIGSGPGIGRATASHFASHGFERVCLLSRNALRLKEDEDAVRKAASGNATKGHSVTVTSHAVDISDLKKLREVLKQVESEGRLECVHFNAARVEPSTVLETPVEEIEKDFMTTNLSLYTVAQWAIPHLLANKTTCTTAQGPSFLITSGLIWEEPVPEVFSLCMVKSAQRSLALTLNKVYGKEVHVALIYVGGVVSEESKTLNPKLIAERIWGVHTQEKGRWERDDVIYE